MTRGNKRDRDRERAQTRAGNKGKQPKDDGLTPEQRRERDAKALQEKAARKAAQAAAGGNNAGGGRGKSNKK
ncbi:putative SERF-like protein isoform X2 [Carica papaya]|uniref:putative SERF-like protein isoform X2 n=1 Tax=Carica papaya TaxID=3649 RepID=UPI000B8CAB8B|nr:putative SERF-like protein isoform X2 [Carica papaya]